MPDVKLTCEVAGCGAEKTAPDITACIALMQLHQAQVHDCNPRQRPPKISRPSLQQGIGEDDWLAFTRRWEVFRQGTDMAPSQVTAQLLACCESQLEVALYREDSAIASKSSEQVMSAMKRLAVISVALSARRTTLLNTSQEGGEPVRQYVARLRGLAAVCEWSKTTTCSKPGCEGVVRTDYTDEIVRMVLLNGLADSEIRKEVLGTPDIDNKTLSDTVAIIDSKETAARAMATEPPRVAANVPKRTQPARVAPTDKDKTFRCACGTVTPTYGRVRGRLKEFTSCLECWRKNNPRRRPGSALPEASRRETRDPETAVFQYAASIDVQGTDALPCVNSVSRQRGGFISIKDHYIFDGTRGWRAGTASPHPTFKVRAEVDTDAYAALGLDGPPRRSADVDAVADSGAQTCLMGLSVLRRLGLGKQHLTRVTKRILAANSEEIDVLGAVFLQLSGRSASQRHITTSAMVYVSDSTDRFYVSRTALSQLKVLDEDFPKVGGAGVAASALSREGELTEDVPTRPAESDMGAAGVDESPHPGSSRLAACGCPPRSPTPGRPAQLPFAAVPENVDRMKSWLLARYAGSTFNVCPHQPLPAMAGPPMEIRVDPNARPSVTRRPPRVAVHWQQDVAEQLQKDVALGVIERVPPNTPVTWLHSMVITPKADGSPRRTVDLQSLNRHCIRETHHTIPPAKQAHAIPSHTVKTVMDAWNGYHSIEIKPEDRHKTTFITEQGRFRYRRAPMGFLVSQDAYTDRYDAIIADVPRKTKCVDDALLWDADTDTHWWRVIDYLERVGSNGVILNPAKFQFSLPDVDFAGFHVTATGIKPLPRYLDAISAFPTPTGIAGVRSWFGLVNQVARYGRITDLMAPFKHLLSPKTKFHWTAQLDAAFRRSKTAIIQEVENGVEIFDPDRRTCISPDWSTTGVGYWMHQRHCQCDSLTPGCCPDGWRVTLVGSRFLRDAEKRYAPVEGEALAVAWALEDSRFFSVGCHDLVVATDHKPLVKVLGDRALDDIQNPRLFRLKQRTLPWRYQIVHVPGKVNAAADAVSRYPPPPDTRSALASIRVDPIDALDGEDTDAIVVAAARSSTAGLGAVTWERVQEATRADQDLQALGRVIESGFPRSRDDLPEALRPFWQHREDLTRTDGVIMTGSRIVIPLSLRGDTLRALHAAHQGVGRMASRAHSAVFWPGMSTDLVRTRAKCQECWRIAPSQPAMPPVTPQPPTRPFQAIAADFFTLRGAGYLVIVDRFSGWPHIVTSLSGQGARGFCRALRSYFSTFGVPDELSTDGGPEFSAVETQDLLKRWGVRHRLSSAYHPQSNGRAEVAVKSMKRLLLTHTTADGGIETDAVAAGLLQFRNTPDPESGLSPAQIVFGRSLRDLLPVTPENTVFDNPAVHPAWRDTWECQEKAMRLRFARQTDVLSRNTRSLPSLAPGDTVLIQNQTGRCPTRWDRTGSVVEVRPNDQYVIKVHGSGRVTLRNRRFLRPITGLLPYERPLGPGPHPSTPLPVVSTPGPSSAAAFPPHPTGTGDSPPVSAGGASAPPVVTGEAATPFTPTAAVQSPPRALGGPPPQHEASSGSPATPSPTPAISSPNASQRRQSPRAAAQPPLPTVEDQLLRAAEQRPPSPQPTTRRGQRTRRAPRYLNDYVCDR